MKLGIGQMTQARWRITGERFSPTRLASLLVYAVLLAAALLEKFGRTTNDTKTPLIEEPAAFLKGSLSLWNPQLSLGELQNQAYGYLFPQGPFFLLGEVVGAEPWITERLWSVALLVVGCEGARLVARSMGMSAWPAWLAGMAYGLNPRIISQVGVRSAEILPGAVLPWVLLPIVLALTGRIGHRAAALLSVSAFMFSGAANGTATAAPLPLVVIVLVWGIRRGLATWSLLGWWMGLLMLSSVWWAASLLKLNAYSPPFFDFVEDAKNTTSTTGYLSSLRGSSNWVNYMYTGGHPTWPAGFEFAYNPILVLASGLLAGVGVVGLATMKAPWRTPLVWSSLLGLVALTVGHAGALQSPLAPVVQELLDGPFALLRNVHKIDPVLRLPLAMGVGSALGGLALWASPTRSQDSVRRHLRSAAVAGLVLLTLGMAQPALAMNLRTPGWVEVPDYWQQTAEFLEAAPGDARAWIIPGSGFGVQTWGWTMDEPMSAVATTPWVTRSQVPLVPPETIRILSRLEELLSTGAGSPNMGAMLARLGIQYVVARHDLDPTLAEATAGNLVSLAVARSSGLNRVATFGALDFGPAIEVYEVSRRPTSELDAHPIVDVVTVAGTSADVINAVGEGLIDPDQPAVVQGDSNWNKPADVVGDSFRLRERNFGRVHDAEGPVMAMDEPRQGGRLVPDYPANPGARPVVARYRGIRFVTASSSQGYTNGVGAVRTENAPYAAVDDDPSSGWRSGLYTKPVGQWLEVAFDSKRRLGNVRVTSAISHRLLDEVLTWTVEAGGQSRTAEVDPLTGVATADFDGVAAHRVRFSVAKVKGKPAKGPISILDIDAPGLPADRTLVVPPVGTSPNADYVFTSRPETRACLTTLLGPDCDYSRGRGSDESVGIDRTFDVSAGGRWYFEGRVIARSRPAASQLLDPWFGPTVMRASSILDSDPTVSARMAYDGNPNTTWMADPYDAQPRLVIDWPKPRTVNRISVGQPAWPAVSPVRATINAGKERRDVELGGFGTFEPLRARRLEITFSNPTRGLSPIGLSELYLAPAQVSVPFDGATRTGAVCGYGPLLVVDGEQYPTRVDGLMGDVISGGPLDVSLCGEAADLDLAAGQHRLEFLSTEQFQPVSAKLTSPGPNAHIPKDRDFSVISDEAGRQVVQVAAGSESVLATTRNFNRGWVAELDGRELDVQRVDGWAQGWVLPAGRGGTLQITYAPERSYVIVLIGGLVVSAAILLAGLVTLLRLRMRPATGASGAGRRRRAEVPGRHALLLAGLAPIGWLLGGPAAAAGLLLGAISVRHPRLQVWAAAGLLVMSAILAAAMLSEVRRVDLAIPDALAAIGFVVALSAVGAGASRRADA